MKPRSTPITLTDVFIAAITPNPSHHSNQQPSHSNHPFFNGYAPSSSRNPHAVCEMTDTQKEFKQFLRHEMAKAQHQIERKEHSPHAVTLNDTESHQTLTTWQKQEAERLYQENEEKQRQKRQEEDRRRMDEAEAERKKVSMKEDQEEEARIENFKKHEALLNEAPDLPQMVLEKRIEDLQPLKDPIYRFHDRPKGIPENKNGNLFTVILSRDFLRSPISMLNTLINKNYDFTKLLTGPLLGRLLAQNDSFNDFISDLYKTRPTGLEKKSEKEVWHRILAHHSKSGSIGKSKAIYQTLVINQYSPAELLEFSKVWINAITTSAEVPEVVPFLASRLPEHTNELRELGKKKLFR